MKTQILYSILSILGIAFLVGILFNLIGRTSSLEEDISYLQMQIERKNAFSTQEFDKHKHLVYNFISNISEVLELEIDQEKNILYSEKLNRMEANNNATHSS